MGELSFTLKVCMSGAVAPNSINFHKSFNSSFSPIPFQFYQKKEEDSRKERQDKLKEKENVRVSTKKKEGQEEKREGYKRD